MILESFNVYSVSSTRFTDWIRAGTISFTLTRLKLIRRASYHYKDHPIMVVFAVLGEHFAGFMFGIFLWLCGRAAVSEVPRELGISFQGTDSNMTSASN